jgi:hypothetical protein
LNPSVENTADPNATTVPSFILVKVNRANDAAFPVLTLSTETSTTSPLFKPAGNSIDNETGRDSGTSEKDRHRARVAMAQTEPPAATSCELHASAAITARKREVVGVMRRGFTKVRSAKEAGDMVGVEGAERFDALFTCEQKKTGRDAPGVYRFVEIVEVLCEFPGPESGVFVFILSHCPRTRSKDRHQNQFLGSRKQVEDSNDIFCGPRRQWPAERRSGVFTCVPTENFLICSATRTVEVESPDAG